MARRALPGLPGALNPVSPFPAPNYVPNPNFPELDDRKLIPAVRREELRNRALWNTLPAPKPQLKDGNMYHYERSWVWRKGTEVSDEHLVRIDLNPNGPITGSIRFSGPSGEERAVGWQSDASTMAGDAASLIELNPGIFGWLDRKAKEWNVKSYIDLGGKRGEETIEEMSLDLATLKAIGDTFPASRWDTGALAEIQQAADGLKPALAMMEQMNYNMNVGQVEHLSADAWVNLGSPDPAGWSDALQGLRVEKRQGKVFLSKDVAMFNHGAGTRDNPLQGAYRMRIEVNPLARDGEDALVVYNMGRSGGTSNKPWTTMKRYDGTFPLSAEKFAAQKKDLTNFSRMSKQKEAEREDVKAASKRAPPPPPPQQPPNGPRPSGPQDYGEKINEQAGWFATALASFVAAGISATLTEAVVNAAGGSALENFGIGPPIRLSAIITAFVMGGTFHEMGHDGTAGMLWLLVYGLAFGKMFVAYRREGR